MKEKVPVLKKRKLQLSILCFFSGSIFLLYFTAKWDRTRLDRVFLTNKPNLPRRQDWLKENEPAFCDALKQFPQPNDPHCKAVKNDVTCNATKPQFFSQDGEDYYLYTRHFAKLNRPGVYVDIAANDAVHISNTYFMDRCLGWSGICAEANSVYFEKLFRERSCLLVPTCISDTDGNIVKFGMRGASGGIVDTYKGDREALEDGPLTTLRCTTLERTFKRVGLKHIDYLSLDVEGHELMVLKGIDWDSVQINIITVELSSQNRQEVGAFLQDKGFRRIDSGAQKVNGLGRFHMNDPVFVHESQVIGIPV